MSFPRLLDWEHCEFVLSVVEQVRLVKLWSIELARNEEQSMILFPRRKSVVTGIFFGCRGGASRMTMGACSAGGGG